MTAKKRDWEKEGYESVGTGQIIKLDDDNPVVEGTLIAIRDGQFGPLFDIKKEDGETVTLPSDTVLVTKLTKDLVGKQIGVEYTGDVPSTKRKGKSYKNYEVWKK